MHERGVDLARQCIERPAGVARRQHQQCIDERRAGAAGLRGKAVAQGARHGALVRRACGVGEKAIVAGQRQDDVVAVAARGRHRGDEVGDGIGDGVEIADHRGRAVVLDDEVALRRPIETCGLEDAQGRTRDIDAAVDDHAVRLAGDIGLDHQRAEVGVVAVDGLRADGVAGRVRRPAVQRERADLPRSPEVPARVDGHVGGYAAVDDQHAGIDDRRA